MFQRKEDKYFGILRNKGFPHVYKVNGIDVAGAKGFFAKVQLKNSGNNAEELFSVSHEAVYSSN